jgi:hypothetical protein
MTTMIFRCTKFSFLILGLLCTACGVGGGQALPSPTGEHTPGSQGGTQTNVPAPTASQVIPTPSETALPAPRTFTENFNTDLSNWTFRQIDNGQPAATPSTRDGFLAFDLGTTNQWAYALYEPQEYGDVMVEAQAQSRTVGDGAAGIVCRYDEKHGWYELNVYADHTYELLFGEWLAQGVARYTPLYQGRSEKIQVDTNEIGLSCQGNILTPVINGTQMRRWQEQKFALQEGKIGLLASSFQDAPFTIAFDWVKVSAP